MRASTVAAILAFTTGMTANAAPVVLSDVLTARACALEPGMDPLQCNDVVVVADGTFVGETIQDKTSEEAQPVAKREPQRGRGRGGRGRAGRVGDVVEGVTGGIGAGADGIFIAETIQGQTSEEAQPVAKREPQRGRGRGGRDRVGGVAEGVVGGIGGAADAIFIGQTIQGQTSEEAQPVAKREPQRGRGRGGRGRVGGVAEGVVGGIGGAADAIFIGQTIQGQTSEEAQPVAKREPQRGRGRGGRGRVGGVAEGVVGGIGGAADAIFIGQTIQGQTSEEAQPVAKREPQRGQGRGGRGRVGGVAEGVVGGIGGAADGIFIAETIQGQTSEEAQPVAKREPQRGQGRGGRGRIGDVAEDGAADVNVGGICEIGSVSACNGEPQRGRGRGGRGRIGDVAEDGAADVNVGSICDVGQTCLE